MNENAKKWVEALESGEYQQGEGYLTQIEDGKEFHCCLGVACQLYLRAGGALDVQRGAEYTSYNGQSGSLPTSVTNWLGLKTDLGDFGQRIKLDTDAGEADDLTGLNDGGWNFSEIADFIRSEPEGLFES